VCLQENSSFANFGRVSACAVCKCAVLWVGCFYFLVFLQQIVRCRCFFSLVPNGCGYEHWRNSEPLNYPTRQTLPARRGAKYTAKPAIAYEPLLAADIIS